MTGRVGDPALPRRDVVAPDAKRAAFPLDFRFPAILCDEGPRIVDG